MSRLGKFINGLLFGFVLTGAEIRIIEMSYNEKIIEIKKLRSYYTNVLNHDIGINYST